MKSRLKNFLNYGAVGLIAALGFQPVGIFFAFLGSFAWLFAEISTSKRSLKDIMIGSFIFFWCFYVANLYWIAAPLTIDFSRHGILIPFAVAIIPACLSLYLLPSVFITRRYFGETYQKIFVFSSLFCISAYIYSHFPTEFPWVLPGYIWNFHEIFMQSLSIFGIYGLSMITMLMACFCGSAYIFFKKKYRKDMLISLAAAGLLFIFMTIFGLVRLSFNPTQFTEYKARIVQCNIPQVSKNDRKLSDQNLQEHLNFSYHEGKIDFIIWPEASIPYLYDEEYEELHDFLRSFLKDGEFLIAGTVRKDLKTLKIHNSIIVINHLGKNVAIYDKVRLVPFGEFIPFRKYIPFQSVASDIGDFDVGSSKNALKINGLKIAMTVCYEAVFPLEFMKLSQNRGTDLIVNLTNDGWFGFTSEPFQHLQIVRARSVEMGIPLIRATNFGVSAVFDPCGRLLNSIPFNQAEFIDTYVPKKLSKQTPYGQYGDLIFWLLILIAIILSTCKIRNVQNNRFL